MVTGQMRVIRVEKAKKRRGPINQKSYWYETEFLVHQVGAGQEVKCKPGAKVTEKRRS